MIAVAATLVTGAGGAARASFTPEPAAHRAYTVRPGDTVWGIARALAGPTGDPRPIVDRIVAENDLEGSALRPGQALTIPSS